MRVEFKTCKHGHFFYLPNDHILGRGLAKYGEYSEPEVDVFRQLVGPGHVVLDVGANIGAFTVPFGRFVGPTGRVWAFEPQWSVAQILVANCAINQIPAKVHAVAVGNEAKKTSIPNFGEYNLQYNYGRVEVGEPATSVWSVDQVRLDDLDLDEPIRFIKLDVEGMEVEALKGAKELIETNWPILFVENDRKAKAKELMDYVASIGYKAYWHIAPLFNPDNFFHDPEDIFGAQASFNMLCTPPDGPNQITFECEMLPVNDETLAKVMPGLS